MLAQMVVEDLTVSLVMRECVVLMELMVAMAQMVNKVFLAFPASPANVVLLAIQD